MKHIITIATSNYLRYVRRLLTSLRKTNRDFLLTIYCDDRGGFGILENTCICELIELPSIRTLGVKRAKFEAYYDAIRRGGFLYLDADIIVLDDLSELLGGDSLRGCFDDLSACPYITNKEYPWTGDPALRNALYINSGIFYAPQQRQPFFREMYEKSLEDEAWQAYTLKELHDNHFLCAFINMKKEPIELVDGEVYNWQGFNRTGSLMVNRSGDSLVNRLNQKKLKLVHFAGVYDMDGFLMGLPLDVSSLILHYGVDTDSLFSERELFAYLASLKDHFSTSPNDELVVNAFHALLRELDEMASHQFRKRYSGLESYLKDRDTILSAALAKPNSHNTWNGLKCDGVYLEAREYAHMRDLITAYGIGSVVEAGAGESSALFRGLDLKTLSIEATLSPWSEHGINHGCAVKNVPFLNDKVLFDEQGIADALRTFSETVDLIFIDSSISTRNRSRILTQILHHVEAKYVLFHDTLRDAANIYSYQVLHDLTLIDFLPTARGMALFRIGRPKDKALSPASLPKSLFRLLRGTFSKQKSNSPRMIRKPSNIVVTDPSYELAADFPDAVRPNRMAYARVTLTNTGTDVLSSSYKNPIFITYHWFYSDGRTFVYERPRTPLPCDIHPGDALGFEMEIISPDATGAFLLEIDLVQELICWFKDKNHELGKRLAVSVSGELL
ncbi:MAG: hypothetical protein ACHQ0Y_10560 [Thermodesulfovibrionales bacterium]